MFKLRRIKSSEWINRISYWRHLEANYTLAKSLGLEKLKTSFCGIEVDMQRGVVGDVGLCVVHLLSYSYESANESVERTPDQRLPLQVTRCMCVDGGKRMTWGSVL